MPAQFRTVCRARGLSPGDFPDLQKFVAVAKEVDFAQFPRVNGSRMKKGKMMQELEAALNNAIRAHGFRCLGRRVRRRARDGVEQRERGGDGDLSSTSSVLKLQLGRLSAIRASSRWPRRLDFFSSHFGTGELLDGVCMKCKGKMPHAGHVAGQHVPRTAVAPCFAADDALLLAVWN